MADRNQVKIIIHVLKNAPRRILTYLESRILKIGPLVQKLQHVSKCWKLPCSHITCKICNFWTSGPAARCRYFQGNRDIYDFGADVV